MNLAICKLSVFSGCQLSKKSILRKASIAALKTQKSGLMQKLITLQWRLPISAATN